MVMLLHGAETLEAAVDRVYREQTDRAANVVRDQDVVDALEEWLGDDRARVTKTHLVNVARQAKNAYLKRHRPKMVGGQLALFQPHYLIPLGKGRHAWLDHASREQAIEWRAVEVAAFSHTRATYDEKIRQIDERIDKWGNHATFGQVERIEFHWAPSDLGYDDDDADDDD